VFDNVPSVAITALDTLYELNSGVVQQTGIPAGGTFSGTGVSGNTFNPLLAGVGGPYILTYNYTETNSGCSNFATHTFSVYENPTGVKNISETEKIHVYPNPATDILNIFFNNNSNDAVVKIYNTLGALVKDQSFSAAKNILISVETLTTGLYFGEITVQEKTYPFRFLKH
jgi:hypothetical protein